MFCRVHHLVVMGGGEYGWHEQNWHHQQGTSKTGMFHSMLSIYDARCGQTSSCLRFCCLHRGMLPRTMSCSNVSASSGRASTLLSRTRSLIVLPHSMSGSSNFG